MKTRLGQSQKQKFLLFWCPGCDQAHQVIVEGERAWSWNDKRDKATIYPSLLVTSHDKTQCHSFIIDGNIQFLSDCSHQLAGQILPLPEWPAEHMAFHIPGETD